MPFGSLSPGQLFLRTSDLEICLLLPPMQFRDLANKNCQTHHIGRELWLLSRKVFWEGETKQQKTDAGVAHYIQRDALWLLMAKFVRKCWGTIVLTFKIYPRSPDSMTVKSFPEASIWWLSDFGPGFSKIDMKMFILRHVSKVGSTKYCKLQYKTGLSRIGVG